MNTLGNVLVAALLVLVLFLCWRMDNLSSQLAMEKARHEATAKDLRTALDENAQWSAAHELTLQATEAHKQNAEACLAREARALADANTRATIMGKATPRATTAKDKVLDHETRTRIVTRLNRGL